jgi:hypothetical protein
MTRGFVEQGYIFKRSRVPKKFGITTSGFSSLKLEPAVEQ